MLRSNNIMLQMLRSQDAFNGKYYLAITPKRNANGGHSPSRQNNRARDRTSCIARFWRGRINWYTEGVWCAPIYSQVIMGSTGRIRIWSPWMGKMAGRFWGKVPGFHSWFARRKDVIPGIVTSDNFKRKKRSKLPARMAGTTIRIIQWDMKREKTAIQDHWTCG